jgi:hypothetical protein
VCDARAIVFSSASSASEQKKRATDEAFHQHVVYVLSQTAASHFLTPFFHSNRFTVVRNQERIDQSAAGSITWMVSK